MKSNLTLEIGGLNNQMYSEMITQYRMRLEESAVDFSGNQKRLRNQSGQYKRIKFLFLMV